MTQASLQAIARQVSRKSGQYMEDLSSLCDTLGIPAGQINERLGTLAAQVPQYALPYLLSLTDAQLQGLFGVLKALSNYAASNLYLPGLGTISGIETGNYSDAGTTFAVVGDPVYQVTDTQGGVTAVRTVLANRPILARDGSNYCWTFDGVNQNWSLGSPLFQITDDHSVTAGVANERASGASIVFAEANSLSVRCGQLLFNNNTPTASWADDAGTGNVAVSGGAQALGTPMVLSTRKVGYPLLTSTLRVNGVLVNSGGPATFGATTVEAYTIGCHKLIPANLFQGRLYGLCAVKGTVSTADLLTIERFIGSLTGPTGLQF